VAGWHGVDVSRGGGGRSWATPWTPTTSSAETQTLILDKTRPALPVVPRPVKSSITVDTTPARRLTSHGVAEEWLTACRLEVGGSLAGQRLGERWWCSVRSADTPPVGMLDGDPLALEADGGTFHHGRLVCGWFALCRVGSTTVVGGLVGSIPVLTWANAGLAIAADNLTCANRSVLAPDWRPAGRPTRSCQSGLTPLPKKRIVVEGRTPLQRRGPARMAAPHTTQLYGIPRTSFYAPGCRIPDRETKEGSRCQGRRGGFSPRTCRLPTSDPDPRRQAVGWLVGSGPHGSPRVEIAGLLRAVHLA